MTSDVRGNALAWTDGQPLAEPLPPLRNFPEGTEFYAETMNLPFSIPRALMNKTLILLAATLCAFTFVSSAQDTNSLRTNLGVLEAQTGVIIIKGFGSVGTIPIGADVIAVRTKESSDITSGLKAYGLAVQVEANSLPRERIYVDYDEIDSLLGAMDYLIKIKYDVTALPGFEASYTTKAGLRIIANSIRREGAVQHSLQYGDSPRIMLSSIQMTQLHDLIEQGRKNLDALKADK